MLSGGSISLGAEVKKSPYLKTLNILPSVPISSFPLPVLHQIGPQYVVQFITNNATNCKSAGRAIEHDYSHIFRTPCVICNHNLALKNICAAKNTDANEIVYHECNWIRRFPMMFFLLKIS